MSKSPEGGPSPTRNVKSMNMNLANPRIISRHSTLSRGQSLGDRFTVENLDMDSYHTGSPPRAISNLSRGGLTLNINLLQDKDIESLILDTDKDPYTKMHLMSRLIASLRS